MELTITAVDYAPEELDHQLPRVIELLQEMAGDDRPDYCIGKTKCPITWMRDNRETRFDYVVVAARWQ